MFSYLDAHPDLPSLEALLEDYWRLMPQYQVVDMPGTIAFGSTSTFTILVHIQTPCTLNYPVLCLEVLRICARRGAGDQPLVLVAI